MTLTDALMAAAALWLLFVFCGVPGQRPRTTAISWERPFASGITASAGSSTGATPYSVAQREIARPRHVTPPLPETDAVVTIVGDGISGNAYAALGSTTVQAIGQPQVLSLTEVTIEPGRTLTLANLGGSGLIVLDVGWLELTECSGNTRLTRSPAGAAPPSPEADSGPTLSAGDRIAFGPGATIVLRNAGEDVAQLLAASVVAIPALAA